MTPAPTTPAKPRDGAATIERPILFSSEMVRAILDGRKCQTRRVIKPQFSKTWGYGVRNQDPEYFSAHVDIKEPNGEWRWLRCPYGKRGDTLWVRETWAIFASSYDFEYGWEGVGLVDIGIPKTKPESKCYNVVYAADGYWAEEGERWRPSIHMPRWASRITLEITNIRVERLFDISQEDAQAEGVSIEDTRTLTHVGAFAITWDKINKKRGYGWEGGTNPWVWAITFRRLQPLLEVT